jgi:hypothetical protein
VIVGWIVLMLLIAAGLVALDKGNVKVMAGCWVAAVLLIVFLFPAIITA